MPPRFPDTWRVDPEASYRRVRRRSDRVRRRRSIAALLGRLRRRGRGPERVGGDVVAQDGS
jgi:hypothetical protein